MNGFEYHPILIDLGKTDRHGKCFMDAQPSLEATLASTKGDIVVYKREWQTWYQRRMTYDTEAVEFDINNTLRRLAGCIGHPLRECRTFLMGTDERTDGPDQAVFIMPEGWDPIVRWFVHIEGAEDTDETGWYAVFTPAARG